MADRILTIKEYRDQHAMLSDICLVCHKPIQIMCRKFTGICSENCQKQLSGETVPQPIETEGHHASE